MGIMILMDLVLVLIMAVLIVEIFYIPTALRCMNIQISHVVHGLLAPLAGLIIILLALIGVPTGGVLSGY